MAEELQHFGVKGMKWGVRKQRANRRINRWKKGGTTNRKTKAVALEAGKFLVANTILAIGTQVASPALRHLPQVHDGAMLVAHALNLGAFVNSVANSVDIIRTDRKRG